MFVRRLSDPRPNLYVNSANKRFPGMASGNTGSDSISFVSRLHFVIDLHREKFGRGLMRYSCRESWPAHGTWEILVIRWSLLVGHHSDMHGTRLGRGKKNRGPAPAPSRFRRVMRSRLYRFFGRAGEPRLFEKIFFFPPTRFQLRRAEKNRTIPQCRRQLASSPAAPETNFPRCCFITADFAPALIPAPVFGFARGCLHGSTLFLSFFRRFTEAG